jgi:hypothetical protein
VTGELTAHRPPGSAGAPGGAGSGEAPVPQVELQELFLAMDKAARAQRLYQKNNPVYQGFVAALAACFARLWDRTSALSVTVDEAGFHCYGWTFPVGEGRDNLAFTFYKDGVRVLTFLPGFEEEAERFLGVVNRARQADARDTDDLVTLLWEMEFSAFQYSYVDALADGLDLPESGAPPSGAIDLGDLRLDLTAGDDPEETAPLVRDGQPTVATSVRREDFVETLYFLEPEEMDYLRQEVELEWERDVKAAVLDALFDRLEDPLPERQLEILRILRQLLPAYLGRGDLLTAARVLRDVKEAVANGLLVGDAQVAEAGDLIASLGDPVVLGQLLDALEDGSIEPGADELGVFLANLGPDALPLLLRASETSASAVLRGRLNAAVESLARNHTRVLIGLIGADDTAVALGAARLSGQLQVNDAAPHIASLLRRSDETGRRVAIDALVQLRTSIAMAAAQEALEDEDREVRIAAARGLAAARFQPARQRLEGLIQSRLIREADLTEQIAFFEAYGAVASADSVRLLDRLLNGRRLLGKESPEIRACAAMALGKVGSPEARQALMQAVQETHPMVRSAVAKALGEGGGR